MKKKQRTIGKVEDIRFFLKEIFSDNMHAKRLESMANATLGVLNSTSLAILTIDLGLANARGLITKHAIKQVDRLVGNLGLDVWESFSYWVPYIVAERRALLIAMDWTEFDADGHSMISLNLLTQHGRATPLLWKPVKKSDLKERRNAYEDELLCRLKKVFPAERKVTLIADRGFGDPQLMAFLQDVLQFDYLIRMKKNIWVASSTGERRKSADWVLANGRAKTLRQAHITADGFLVPTVVCVWAKDMKEAWCLASSHATVKSAELFKYYGKRWGIETYFRDTKDPRFGMGMRATRTANCQRRDRLFLLSAFAIVLLTLLGAAGESVGFDRTLKANTTKKRTHSLFRQGWMTYELLPNMPDKWLKPIMNTFSKLLKQQRVWESMLGFV